jgi:hypothetical protein
MYHVITFLAKSERMKIPYPARMKKARNRCRSREIVT